MTKRKIVCVCTAALLVVLSGCGRGDALAPTEAPSEPVVYASSVEKADCALCGTSADGPLAELWGTDNLALLSVNTFAPEILDINDPAAPDMRTHYFSGGENGAFGIVDDYAKRGLAFGNIALKEDAVYAPEQAAAYLCADCLESIAAPGASAVGVVNLETRELRLFREKNSGFTLGNFYIAYTCEKARLGFLAIYCPPRDTA